ncbi:ABC transporter substrate-binding protein [Pseudonocardia sp. GCM10023141]|uniref:ABC transporter substrate-binding protein n=1 Tax=Pseudonocardia sp. GCM10023141 TaxID=3252653 RepID=UPI00360E20F9
MLTRRKLLTAVATSAVALQLVACSGGGSAASVDPNAPVTITVGDRPTADNVADLKQYDDTVAEFMKANPNIKVETSETAWQAQTFQAQVAGGTLPTVLKVAFTEPALLIANKQLPDLTDPLKQSGILDQLNPALLKNVTRDGRIYAVPIYAYTMGLIYNRDLFARAGLDPNKPPTTWDEVRTAAREITQKTGATGFAQLSTKNQGGWTFTNMVYGLGGQIESEDGKTPLLSSDQVKQGLQLIKDMRWSDNSLGSQYLYDADGANQDFAAGKVGMMVHLPDVYNDLVRKFGMKPESVGVGPSPQAGAKQDGVLVGGNVSIISIKATPAQQAAALKYIQFSEFRQYSDQSVAVAKAKATVADGKFVGIPGVTPLNQAEYDTWQSWLAPVRNVSEQAFKPYGDSLTTMPLLAEPPNKTQEVYKALDTVVQKTLTDPSADPAALLNEANSTVAAKLGR